MKKSNDSYVGFDERFTEQSGDHLFEAGAHQWQEDAGDDDMITGLCLACDLTTAHDGHRTWNVTDWHLIAVLLNFQLLEFNEFRATRLQIQSTARFIDTTIFGRAISDRHE